MLTRRTLLKTPAAAAAATMFGAGSAAAASQAKADVGTIHGGQTQVQLIRSATIKVALGGTVFLIDPMLAPRGAWPGFQYSVNSEARNPLTDLPMSVEQALSGVDAVVLTHLHDDHWDEEARRRIPKDMPIFTDSEAHRQELFKAGFTNVMVLEPKTVFKGVTLSPQMSQHGPDEVLAYHPLGDLLGTTMGIFFERKGSKSVYVVGDSVWKPFITMQISTLRPDVIVLNTGNALMTECADSIIMGTADFMRAYREAPWAKIVAVHMDAINHCVLKRHDLRDVVALHKLDPNRALIPNDGEVLRFS